MIINKQNYEVILMDYLDGILSDTERAEVDLFLQQNPEIAKDIDGLEDVLLIENSDLTYSHKEELLAINWSNEDFEQWENNYPKLPQETQIYPYKFNLLKSEKHRLQPFLPLAIAACLAVALFWFFSPTNNPEKPMPSVAQNSPHKPSTVDLEHHATNPIEEQAPIVSQIKPSTPSSFTPKTILDEQPLYAEHSKTETVVQPLQISMVASLTVSPLNLSELAEKSSVQTLELPEKPNILQLATNDALDLYRSVAHRITKHYYEKKTDVKMRFQQWEFSEYFAEN